MAEEIQLSGDSIIVTLKPNITQRINDQQYLVHTHTSMTIRELRKKFIKDHRMHMLKIKNLINENTILEDF